jgi:isocitrate dehydrogenase (NAD+)
VRENTEDLYAGIEFEEGTPQAAALIDFVEQNTGAKIRPDSGISIKPISRFASDRIVRFAFEYARTHGRHKVCAVHKANIMKHSDGLFLHTAQDVAREYEGQIDFDTRIIDAFCMNLVMNPAAFDVIVFPNLYGDIASDLAAGLVGGLGLAPGANIGDECAIFEAVHGSAPDIAGRDMANPTAQILSAAMMLDHIGMGDAAKRVRRAIRAVYAEGKVLTADIVAARARLAEEVNNGFSATIAQKPTASENASEPTTTVPAPATCTQFTQAVIDAIC